MSSKLDFEQTKKDVLDFSVERNWHKLSTPRGLAISIVLEASELLEHYQWQKTAVGGKNEIADEVADIMIYLIQFADKYDIDILKSVQKKLRKTAKKYPAQLFQNKDLANRNQAWLDAKKNYKKKSVL